MKAESTHWHTTTKNKKKLQVFLGINNYLGNFSPMTVEVCELVGKLSSAKAEWTWNVTYQTMFEEAKAIIKEGTCMRFYDETKPLYMETDVWVWLRTILLKTRDNMSCHRDQAPDNSIFRHITFSSKRLTEAEKRCSNIEREALGIMCSVDKFNLIALPGS